MAKQILGIHIVQDRTMKLWLSQEKYVTKVLQIFNMQDAKPIGSTLLTNNKLNGSQCPKTKEKAEMSKISYALVVGSLMYAMVCTRSDIAYVVGMVSQFMSNPGKEHWAVVKWILRYLRGTSSVCLTYNSSNPVLEGFTDSDMADVDTNRSTSGYVMMYAGQSRL